MPHFMKNVPEEDRLSHLYLSGLDENGMPGIELLYVYRVLLTHGEKIKDKNGRTRYWGRGRLYYDFLREPTLIPLNGSKTLSRAPYPNQRGFVDTRMIFKNQISHGRRKASFHVTKEQAEQRLYQWIQIRLARSTKEYRYCRRYMNRLGEVAQGKDIVAELHKEKIDKQINPQKRRIIQ